MQKRPRKISYIRKPFAKKSFVSTLFAAASLLCGIASVGISTYLQGNGDINVAAWGVSSIIFAAISLAYSGMSFLEKEMNYLLAKISLGVSASLLIFWFCVIIVGFLG